jgi:pimeloyl-ACP methyl ester carboxylesterase
MEHVPGAGGVRVALHDLGGAGEPLVICHATGFCARAYEPLAAELAGRFRLWGVDLRGHGDAGVPDSGDFAWELLAADLLAVIDHLGLPRVRAFGHSVGGATVLLAARARPGVIAAAYLFEPIVWPRGFDHPGGINPMAGLARRRREEFPSRADALARYASRPPLGLLRADALWAYVEHGLAELDGAGVRLKCRAESEARTFEAETAVTLDLFEDLDLVATVAVGQRGRGGGPAALAPQLVSGLRDGRLVTYDHLGHFGPLQDPETVAADVIAALAGA